MCGAVNGVSDAVSPADTSDFFPIALLVYWTPNNRLAMFHVKSSRVSITSVDVILE